MISRSHYFSLQTLSWSPGFSYEYDKFAGLSAFQYGGTIIFAGGEIEYSLKPEFYGNNDVLVFDTSFEEVDYLFNTDLREPTCVVNMPRDALNCVRKQDHIDG